MIKIAIPIALMLTAWLFAGRRMAQVIDRVLPGKAVPLPIESALYGGGGLKIGGIDLTFGALNNYRGSVGVSSPVADRAVLTDGPTLFPLGPRSNPIDPSGRPEIDFSADPGDELSLTERTSRLSWPNPFEFRILGPVAPSWKRYVYYELDWKKRSGARLHMLWRYQQDFYAEKGWMKPVMMWNYHTGLVTVEIEPDSVVEQYISRTKGWARNDYRILRGDAAAEQDLERYDVIHREDECAVHPGAGKSLQVLVNRRSQKVEKEIGGQ